MRIFTNIKIIFIKMLNFFKKYLEIFFNNICTSFDRCVEGEENLNKLLWFWCIIPNVFFISKYFVFLYQFTIIKIFIILYVLMCFYFILKAVKVHPEYNISEIKRKEEIEYINSLNENELREYIKEKNTNKVKDVFKKAFLQKAWHVKEFYKITQLFLLVMFLCTLLKLF